MLRTKKFAGESESSVLAMGVYKDSRDGFSASVDDQHVFPVLIADDVLVAFLTGLAWGQVSIIQGVVEAVPSSFGIGQVATPVGQIVTWALEWEAALIWSNGGKVQNGI